MKVEMLRDTIRVITDEKQYFIALPDLKEAFAEKRVRFEDVHWDVFGEFIVFSAVIFGFRYGTVNSKIVFDTRSGTFTDEHICIHTAGGESKFTMATIAFNDQQHTISWNELRKQFGVEFFDVHALAYESVDYIITFQLCGKACTYVFDFDMKDGSVKNHKVMGVERRFGRAGGKTPQLLDYNPCIMRLRNTWEGGEEN